MKQQRSRRHLIISPHYQTSQAITTIILTVLVALLVAFLVSWFYLLFFNTRLVTNYSLEFPLSLGGAIIILLVCSMFWSLHHSRIIAGMVKKIEKVLSDGALGKFSSQPVQFRTNDHFKELASPINCCLLRLKNQQTILEKQHRGLQELDQQLASGKTDSESIRSEIARLLAQIHENSN